MLPTDHNAGCDKSLIKVILAQAESSRYRRSHCGEGTWTDMGEVIAVGWLVWACHCAIASDTAVVQQ